MKYALTIFIFLFSFLNITLSQSKVLMPSINESYEGKCKKGLANGKGKAVGIDTYTGKFKNGLPHGKGKYTWANGEFFEGNWKNGKKNGEGKFYYKDSVLHGIWYADKFVKKIIPKPYNVTQNRNLSNYSVNKTGEINKVEFTINRNGMPSTDYFGLNISNSSGNTYTNGNVFGIESIQIPFSCTLTYSILSAMRTSSTEVVFEIEITEPGTWKIQLKN